MVVCIAEMRDSMHDLDLPFCMLESMEARMPVVGDTFPAVGDGPASGATYGRRPPVNHRVKSWPRLFEAIRTGEKAFELRRSTDRDFRIGDTLMLMEYEPGTEMYTGRTLPVRITYVTSGEHPCALSGQGLHEGFCILGISLT